MKNVFKRAGVWNILCGVLVTLAYVGIYVVMGVDFAGSEGEELASYIFYGAIVTYIGVYLWEILIFFPFFMILAGTELISKHKKGAGVRLFIVFNMLMKILSALLCALCGAVFIATAYVTAVAYGVFLALVALIIAISIILDIPAVFAKQKVMENK